ncbi:MAG: UDP-N-acetylglucosamine 2-epimerase (non-hydrolyzing) [Anaerovoracaceae bacterium]|nr:UDP-N-acetylglucosamine 2-epimerase (non-hydrolyzing) [Anaerovoracaceae bacterium]
MKVITVVGARPQFIKEAVVSRQLRKYHDEVIVHTGQHYDYNMSDVFFTELEIPHPDYNLGISGGTHGKMTGEMLIAIEEVLLKEKPDAVLLFGDTNSTLAGALAAVKLHIPVLHVEAGTRLGTLDNPEEVNRIVSDHVSYLKFYCTRSAGEFLEREGISKNSFMSGDPMFDAFLYYSEKVGGDIPEELRTLDGTAADVPSRFNYLTCHRQENTNDPETLHQVLLAMETTGVPCIYPVHPRNRETVRELEKRNKYKNVIFCEPVGYLMSVYLVNHADMIVTDSGGLQREAFFAEKQCITVFDYVIWPETMVDNRNQLARPDAEDILRKMGNKQIITDIAPFGDGHASEKIVDIINKNF